MTAEDFENRLAGDRRFELASAEDTEALGAQLASACRGGMILYLSGNLGTGKTTLARAFLGALGHTGRARSPTYTLVEPYQIGQRTVFHFDLYRLADPEELEFLGIRDYLEPEAVWLVEWPERGLGVLPASDLEVALRYTLAGREAKLHACTEVGRSFLGRLRGPSSWAN